LEQDLSLTSRRHAQAQLTVNDPDGIVTYIEQTASNSQTVFLVPRKSSEAPASPWVLIIICLPLVFHALTLITTDKWQR